MADDDRLKQLRDLSYRFMDLVPHNRALGIHIVALADGEATMSLPYDEKLVGNPETGVLHGGAVTSLMDACSGAAVFMKLTSLSPIATLDLRIDYLKPATPGEDVIAHAVCYKLTRSIAFVRCLAHHGDPEHAIAAAAGAFMLATRLGNVGAAEGEAR
jgi:uncharacterized protein (TIGR00369 family)